MFIESYQSMSLDTSSSVSLLTPQTPFPTQPSSLLLHGPIDGLVEHRRVDMVEGLLLSNPTSAVVASFFQFCPRVWCFPW